MPLHPDDPDLESVISISADELDKLEASTLVMLRRIYRRQIDAVLERIAGTASDSRFSVRHMQVIIKALEEGLGHLQRDLFDQHARAIGRSIELGAGAAARELGQLESRVGSAATARAFASLAGVIPHRAVAAALKLRDFRIIEQIAEAETKNLVIEIDRKARATVIQALIQGRNSRDVVPDLRQKIGQTAESASWQLERTLRTGLNAAVNRGHNAGYLEAQELLPDLQRMGHEFLRRAEKKSGRRSVNHPFSFWLHAAVTDLNKPWVIDPHGPPASGFRPVRAFKVPFPMMFWPYKDGRYVGMHYPAHLWEGGRQVPYREAWERRRGKMVAVQELPRAAEEAERIRKGVQVDEVRSDGTVSAGDRDSVLRTLQTAGFDTWLKDPARKLGGVSFERGLTTVDGKPATALYDPASRMIRLNTRRAADEFGRNLVPGQIYAVSDAGRSELEAIRRSIIHELGHHIHNLHPELEEEVRSVKKRATPISIRATRNWKEYLAESLVAYAFEPKALNKHDPAGYKMIERVLKDLGVR